MGYLGGVHFRALLSALSMSNGQLTHHLKHLEGDGKFGEEDGRLVRFIQRRFNQTLKMNYQFHCLLGSKQPSRQDSLLDATENDIVNLSQKEWRFD